MSAMAAVRLENSMLAKACPALPVFLATLAGRSELGLWAQRKLDGLSPDQLGAFPALMRMPHLVRGALDVCELVIAGVPRSDTARTKDARRLILYAQRIRQQGRRMTSLQREEIVFLITAPKRDYLAVAAAFAVCSANAVACVKLGVPYIAIDDEAAHDAREDGFPGAISAADAFGFAFEAASTRAQRTAVIAVADRVYHETLRPVGVA